MINFDEAYFTQGNYEGYLDRGERYARMTREIDELLTKINLVKKSDPILDFGCGVGHVLKALHSLDYHDLTGYDISKWAIGFAKNFVRSKNIKIFNDKMMLSKHYHLTFALDVLEHIPEEFLNDAIRDLRARYVIFRAPVCATNGGQYILKRSENDKTHVVRFTKDEWRDRFFGQGYRQLFTLNLNTIWNGEGVMSAVFVKD